MKRASHRVPAFRHVYAQMNRSWAGLERAPLSSAQEAAAVAAMVAAARAAVMWISWANEEGDKQQNKSFCVTR